MAYMYLQSDSFDNLGEKSVYAALRDFLPGGYICYHNRKVGILEFDFAVLAPGYGIVIIEVKGHRAEDIKNVRDNNIHLRNGELVYSPYEQANKYRFALAPIIKKKIGKEVPVFAMAAFPFITAAEYKEKELHLLSNRESTLLADDLNAGLTDRIEKLVIQGRRETQKQFSELTLNITEQIRLLFEPKEVLDGYQALTDARIGKESRTAYSILTSITIEEAGEDLKAQLLPLINEWKRGTKLILFLHNRTVQDYALSLFQNEIKALDSVSFGHFTLYKPKSRIICTQNEKP